MKSKPFVLLDRDGTIIVERHYLSDPAQVELIPGAARGLRKMQKMGLGLAAITNQSGIGRGYFSLARLTEIHQRMCQLLAVEGVDLDQIYYCPHRPEDNCQCRKPLTGMVQLAAKELGFDPQRSFVIGDKPCDIQLGQKVGATTFLVKTGYGAAIAAEGTVTPDYIVDDLEEAANKIEFLIFQSQRIITDAAKG
ncbi:D-glycero-beta-D-manno-heptose 1,7-bisphosphate 7-phosphatase [Aerosakkonemataceae cyanobacterium BLCC-F154]|uniref:D,D-heptose 1,7-bisphosphate phosphatase n=1 Tax=Floridaenema fluviatile BLCC-F154 TaxID=3153640 RepID=A0ABV4YEG2_9CYAN